MKELSEKEQIDLEEQERLLFVQNFTYKNCVAYFFNNHMKAPI